jgi:hypothetical protein
MSSPLIKTALIIITNITIAHTPSPNLPCSGCYWSLDFLAQGTTDQETSLAQDTTDLETYFSRYYWPRDFYGLTIKDFL